MDIDRLDEIALLAEKAAESLIADHLAIDIILSGKIGDKTAEGIDILFVGLYDTVGGTNSIIAQCLFSATSLYNYEEEENLKSDKGRNSEKITFSSH